MRYVLARYDEMCRDRAYRIYVTDILRGAFASESMRYADIFKPAETRTAGEVIAYYKERLGNGSV